MLYPFEEQILTAWKALCLINNQVGWVSIPIYSSSNWSIAAGYNLSNHEQAIFFKIDYTEIFFTKFKLPMTHGFKIQQLKDGNGIALIRQVEGDLDLFTKIAVDVCNTIIECQTLAENQLFSVVLNRINAWLSFMRKGFDTLSPEVELGLVGELETLSSLISANIPISDVLDSWIGPLDGLKDFELGSGAVEIKSTLSSSSFVAKIGSLEQLDDSQISPLFINGYRFSINETGLTLVERINLLRDQLIDFPSELSRLNNLLLRGGYLDTAAENYTRKFKTENSYFWIVDNNFPRLVPGNIAVNIKQVRYEIDLTPLINESINLSLVLQKLGIGNSGIK